MPASITENRNIWMRWRVRLGYPVGVAFWLLASPTAYSMIHGAILAALGLMIRAYAAGYLVKYRQLATTGPYAHTRNPLYFGSSLLAAGFAVAGHSWPGAALIFFYFAAVYYAVMRNEESDLRARYGSVFDLYASQVPLFLPRIWRVKTTAAANSSPPAPKFTWTQYRRNREYQALMGTILGFAVVWIRIDAPAWLAILWRHR
ncbi:MAG: methyltransferase family protein [Candidatus Acidiferrales bacterium]